MDKIRTVPLTGEELDRFSEQGCLFPIRILSEEQAADLRDAIADHLSGRIASPTYELTDPIPIRRIKGTQGKMTFEYEEFEHSKPHTFPFLFNLWKLDERFQKVAFDPVIAGMARQLLGADEVILMEDNVVIKNPHTKTLPWHQDYSYWPLEKPSVVTVWVALDNITAENGAMQVVPGSHKLGERLPVAFGDASALLKEDRPGVEEITQDPAGDDREIITYALKPGECGFHHAMVWHASTPNTSPNHRHAFVLRYAAGGTIWLGNERFPYDEVGVAVGDKIGGPHFPTIGTAF